MAKDGSFSDQDIKRLAKAMNNTTSLAGVQNTGGFTPTPLARASVDIRQAQAKPQPGFWDSVGNSAVTFAKFAPTVPFKIGKAIYDDTYRLFESTTDSLFELATNQRSDQLARNTEASRALAAKERANLQYLKSGRITMAEYEENLKDMGRESQDISESNNQINMESDPIGRALDVVQVGLMPLTGGRIQLPQGVTRFTSSTAIKGLTKALDSVPSVKPLLAKRSGDFMMMNARGMSRKMIADAIADTSAKAITKEFATAAIIRYPLIVGQSTGDVYEIMKTLEGERGIGTAISRSLFLGLAAFEGGPLGFVFKAGRKLGAGGKSLLFGTDSVFDHVGRRMNLKGNLVEAMERIKVIEDSGMMRPILRLDKKVPKKADVWTKGTGISSIDRILQNTETTAGGEDLVSYYGRAKGEHWDIQYMSPDEYIQREFEVRKGFAGDQIPDNVVEYQNRVISQKNVDKFAADMKKGDKFDMPFLNEVAQTQEGRHRALAAKKLGIKSIPVAVATKEARGGAYVFPKGSYERFKQGLRGMQNINLEKSNGNAELAATFVTDFYEKARGFGKEGFPIDSWDALFEDMARYYDNFEAMEDALKKGLIKINGEKVAAKDLRKYALATFDSGAKSSLIRGLKAAQKAGGDEGMVEFLDAVASEGAYYTQHKTLWKFIQNVIKEPDWEKQIKELSTARFMKEMKLPKKLQAQLEQDGYIIVRMQDTRKQVFVERGTGREIVSKFAKDGLDGYEATIEPARYLGSLGAGIRKAGLSPEDTSKVAYDALKRNIGDRLTNLANNVPELKAALNGSPTGAIDDAAVIVHKLQKFASEPDNLSWGGALARGGRSMARRSEVQDIRMLSLDEIARALGVSKATAKAVRRTIYEAHVEIPLQVRGLGDKIVDYNMLYNPLARPYARTQSALRYAWNPFFRTQEIVETEVLGQIVTGGKAVQLPGVNFVRHIFLKSEQEMDELVYTLENAGILSGQFFGEAADDAVLGRITAVISKSQKESLAGIAADMAKNYYPKLDMVSGVDRMIADHYDDLADALRVVVQYPNKSALNSSLARTLNVAFFPMRYNLKVTGLAAKALSQQPIPVQMATIKGIFNMRDWLNSDEGQEWYARHSEAIGVMQWITPIGSMTQVLDLIDGGIPDSAGELGMLGGLPFGVITQMLDSQFDDFNINTPYVRPKTGEVVPEWIPLTAQARVRTAVNDLLMSVFTYPGRIIGMTGKGKIVRSATGKVLPYQPESYRQITRGPDGNFLNPGLTDQQQDYIQTIQEAYGLVPTYEGSYQGPVLPPGPMRLPDMSQTGETTLPNIPVEAPAPRKGRSKRTARPLGYR